jgi:hypothetical protein
MTAYAVSYDLHKKGEFDYENLIKTLKSFENWCHHLESDWVIISDQSAIEVRDLLRLHIHKDDHLIVFRLTGEAAWYGLSDRISNWLKESLAK